MDLKNRVTVITGAASGIGACCAKAFAAQGAKVVAADLNGDGVNQIAQEIGGLAVACELYNYPANYSTSVGRLANCTANIWRNCNHSVD